MSCKQVEEEVWKKTKKKEKEEEERGKYEVVLEDTILFPEGGGQVSKQGINSLKPFIPSSYSAAVRQRNCKKV